MRELAGIEAGLKWPNDVVVADRKLAGILAEKVGAVVVVGMGLNVRWESFPAELAEIATACNLCSTAPVTREEVLVRWLTRLDERLDDLPSVIGDARMRSATLGRRVRVELPGEAFEADAIALSDDGQLVVRRADGTEQPVSAADVVHLRAAANDSENRSKGRADLRIDVARDERAERGGERGGDRSRRGRKRDAVDVRDRLHLARRGRQERFVGVGQRVDRYVGLLAVARRARGAVRG